LVQESLRRASMIVPSGPIFRIAKAMGITALKRHFSHQARKPVT
jgi:hypothetical protein